MSGQAPRQPHRKVILIGGLASAVMFVFCFAIVPFYSLICKATGINTSIPSAELTKPATVAALHLPADMTRSVTVQFIAMNNMNLPWDFYPRVKSVVVHPGQNSKVYFYVKNNAGQPMTIQAVPSMLPTEAFEHFHKIECFCFRHQSLDAHASKDMPLIFQVDKDLPKEIRTITLAYTLFDVTPKETRKT